MWYKTKVIPSVVNVARELVIHISHPETKHWKALGRLVGYIKGKETKCIVIRKPKGIKGVIYLQLYLYNE